MILQCSPWYSKINHEIKINEYLTYFRSKYKMTDCNLFVFNASYEVSDKEPL